MLVVTHVASLDGPGRIVEAQQRLAASGYDAGIADGVLGPRTRAAVAEFQKAKGLPVNGQVSDDVLNALRTR